MTTRNYFLCSFTTESTVNFKLEKKTVTLLLQSERNGWQGPTKAYTQATIHYNADINPHVPDHFSCRIA
jgi:hypothetical protein